MKNKAQITYLKDYRAPDFLITNVTLDFDLHDQKTTVTSVLHCQRNTAGDHDANAPLVLHGETMQLLAIEYEGQPLDKSRYQLTKETLTLSDVSDAFVLKIMVEIDPQANKALNGLYMSRGNYCTQCEPHGFRHITYFTDRPDVMTRFTTTIHADKACYPVLLSNGNLLEKGDEGAGRHWVRWEDPSLKPCYLFALVAGDYECLSDTFKTASGRVVDLKMYVEQGKKDQAAFALASLQRAMAWDESVYGREYDLDIYMVVAVSDFNFGAMENKGLNIFNSKYILANPSVATDKDYMNVERVIGHEYFHNWSGNRITCRDWFQITLKEGLTVFREQGFAADMGTAIIERIQSARGMLTHQFAEDASPTSHPIQPTSYLEVNNFYTHTVYQKGAEVIRMLQTLLGQQGFAQGVDLYFSRHDGQAVTTEDFLKAMEDANTVDLSQFWHWYHQAGTPTIAVTSNYDAEKQTYALMVKQSSVGENAEPYLLPLSISLLDKAGNDMPIQLREDTAPVAAGARVLRVNARETTYEFIHVPEKPVVSLLRNFSAPVHMKYDYTEAELIFLMQHDSDLFNRWRAKEYLMTQHLQALVAQVQSGEPLSIDQRIVAIFKQWLQDPQQDPAFLAEMLMLPSERYLVEVATIADIDAIHQARDFMRKTLATACFDNFLSYYQRSTAEKTAYTYEISAVARRACQHVCLDYLLSLNKAEVTKQAFDQFQTADNMTETLSALSALMQQPGTYAQQALDAFYKQWAQEDLVLDHWFMLQAIADRSDSVAHMQRLMQDPLYTPKNPNRVRALLGSFSQGNLVHFHQKEGKGYRLIANQVIEIDVFNPSLAARLVEPLLRWRKFDAHRQKLMFAELVRIRACEHLSRNVQELVLKGLGDSD